MTVSLWPDEAIKEMVDKYRKDPPSMDWKTFSTRGSTSSSAKYGYYGEPPLMEILDRVKEEEEIKELDKVKDEEPQLFDPAELDIDVDK
jgi:hypothetical protein